MAMSDDKVPRLHKTGPNPWDYEYNPVVGQKVTFVGVNGEELTDTISSVHHSPAQAAIWPELNAWQRTMRRLNPWRKPLQPVRAASLPEVTIRTEKQRHADLLASVADTVEKLTNPPISKRGWLFQLWLGFLRKIGLGNQ